VGDKDQRLKTEAIDLRGPQREARIEVAPMRESDLEEVLRIESSSFSCPWTAEMFRHELSETSVSFCFVAKERPGRAGGRPRAVLGYICIWVVGDEMQIANLAVHPSWRRKGIGSTLLNYAIRFGSRCQARRIFLEVRPSNLAAQSLYGSFGFQAIGFRKGYYQFPSEDALVMSLDIPRTELRGRRSQNRLDNKGPMR